MDALTEQLLKVPGNGGGFFYLDLGDGLKMPVTVLRNHIAERDGERVMYALLPKEEWSIQACGPDHLALALYVRITQAGPHSVHKFKAPRSAFPNDLVGVEDLKRFRVV